MNVLNREVFDKQTADHIPKLDVAGSIQRGRAPTKPFPIVTFAAVTYLKKKI
jgi:hypothetical protein